MKFIIDVDQKYLKASRETGEKTHPPINIRIEEIPGVYSLLMRAHEVFIHGPSKIVHCPSKDKMPFGATVWIETSCSITADGTHIEGA